MAPELGWQSHLNGFLSNSGDGAAPAVPDGFSFHGITPDREQRAHIFAAVSGRIDALADLQRTLGLPSGPSAAPVIAALYLRDGEQFLRALSGEFAAVLWDSRLRKLVLARSALGIEELRYTEHRGAIFFASELRSLVEQTGRLEIDEQGLAAWLALDISLSPNTLLRGIQRVPAGGIVVFQDGRRHIHQVWQPESLPMLRLADPREYEEELLRLLRAAIIHRLPAHRGVATHLSGGLDSSSVTALAAEALALQGRRLLALTAVPGETFDSPFPDRFCDEFEHAAAVAAMYPNVQHERVPNAGGSLLDVLDRFTDAEGRPMLNPDHLLWMARTYAVARDAGAGTLLTGSLGNVSISHRGDFAMTELIAQGRLLHAFRRARTYRRTAHWSMRRILGCAFQGQLAAVFNATDRWRNRQYFVEDFSGLHPRFAAEHGIDLTRLRQRFPHRTGKAMRLWMLRRLEHGNSLRAAKLLYGLDVHDPTADQRLLEFCLSIPEEAYSPDSVPRGLLRNAMQGRLPDAVRLEQRRGLQSADFLVRFARERQAIAAEFDRLMDIELARRALDLEKVRAWMQWTDAQANAYGWHNFLGRTMRTLAIGRYIRRVTEGTLFDTLKSDAATPAALRASP